MNLFPVWFCGSSLWEGHGLTTICASRVTKYLNLESVQTLVQEVAIEKVEWPTGSKGPGMECVEWRLM
jgi:hypothetical protein